MGKFLTILAVVATLASASAAAGTSHVTAYTYDASGNLTSKTENGVVWNHVYDVRDLLNQPKDSSVHQSSNLDVLIERGTVQPVLP